MNPLALFLLGLLLPAAASAATTSNTGGAGTPIGGPASYTEYRQPDRTVDWRFLAGFIDRGVGDDRHSRHLLQQFRGLFPDVDLARLTGTAVHSLTRQCGGSSTACSVVPDTAINNEYYTAKMRAANGSMVELTLSSTGAPQPLAGSADGCRDCSFRRVGAALAYVRNTSDPNAAVGFLYFQTTEGRVVYQTFSSSVTLPGGGAAPFTGPGEFDEDASQSWEADTSRLELPSGAYNIRYVYRWRASDASTGDGPSFSHTFAEPGEATLSLEMEATYTIDVARTRCGVTGTPPRVECQTRPEPEPQGPVSVSGGRRLRVRDTTPPDFTVVFPQGRAAVTETPKDATPPKTAHLVSSGRFTPAVDVRAPYGPFELGRYQIEKNRAFTVETTARDNGGAARTTWRLDLSGAASGTIVEGAGRIDELEANYPVGAVDYKFTATATDTAGNATILGSDVEVRDVDAPEVPLALRHPEPLDEDTIYEFTIESDLIQGESGEPVPPAIVAVARQFTNPTWAGAPEIEKAVIRAEDLGPALQSGRRFRGRTAEIRSVVRSPADGKIKVQMRLLQPGPQRMDLWLRRKFNYEQRIGASGSIRKTELYVKARAAIDLAPRDITPPAITVDLTPADSALPRKGGGVLTLVESPADSEPLPDKTGGALFKQARGFAPDLKGGADGAEGPFAMAKLGSGRGFRWQALVSSLQRPSAAAAPGTALIARDFYVAEDVPVPLSSGSSIVATDNLSTRVDVTAELTDTGASASLDTVRSNGFTAPNFLPERRERDGRILPPRIASEAAAYVLDVSARDEAGNESRLSLPVCVLDVTPPGIELHLLGQDANGDAHVVAKDAVADAPPGSKKIAFDLSGFYFDPAASAAPAFAFEGGLGYPSEEKFWPASGPRLPWTYGLAKGATDGDPGNTPAGFGAGLPDGLRGLLIRQNVRISVKAAATDNLAGPENAEWLRKNGLDWSVEQTDATTVAGGSPENFLIRAPNFPRAKFADAPEYRFVIAATDAAGNTLRLRLPLAVLELNAEYRRVDWEERKARE